MKHISRRNFMKTAGAGATAVGLAACSADSSSAGNASSAGAGSSSENTTLDEGKLSADPVTFKLFASLNGMAFDPNWLIYQKAEEITNVRVEGILSSADSDLESAWNRMLAGGDLPDFVSYNNNAELQKLAFEGGLLPLNDLIEQHAPNIKAAFEEYAGFEAGCTALDGNIYEIRRVTEIYPAEYWWIRKDWLDACGKEIPVTVDDWYDVLTAFRTMDPNGNGQTDEVPLFDRAGYKMPDEYLWFWNFSTEFYAFDGKMVFEPLEEDFKTAVPNLVKWYKEKLIDPEIFTRGPKSRDTLLGNNLGGATHDWVSAGAYNDSLAESVPGFNIIAVPPPANQHGEVYERTRRSNNGTAGWALSYSCKDPVTAIKYIDFWFTETGKMLHSFGVEGDTYTMDADGKVTYTDKIMKSETGTPLAALRACGIAFQHPSVAFAQYELAFMDEAGRAATTLYDSNRQWFRENEPPYLDGRLILSYPDNVSDEYQKIMTPIRTYVDEKLQGWMLGTSDFESDYDGFIAELKARGIERAVEINQIAYETWLETQ